MKAVALIAIISAPALAQDASFFIQETTESGLFVVSAEYNGEIPLGATRIDTIWSDITFQLTGDQPITMGNHHPSLVKRYGPTQPGMDVFGDGTDVVQVETNMLITAFADVYGAPAPDPSNPLHVATFRYDGALASLGFELSGQNSAAFLGNPNHPFGTIALFMDTFGTPNDFTFETVLRPGQISVDEIAFLVPAPSAVAIVPIAFAGLRRRR